MRIGILTQPLHNNYGGLLQAYALQKVLKDMGHEVWTVDLPFNDTFYKYIKGCIIRLILKYIFLRNIETLFPARQTKNERAIISKYTQKFINENIVTTTRIPNVKKINKLSYYNFDAFIVGSDQVYVFRTN